MLTSDIWSTSDMGVFYFYLLQRDSISSSFPMNAARTYLPQSSHKTFRTFSHMFEHSHGIVPAFRNCRRKSFTAHILANILANNFSTFSVHVRKHARIQNLRAGGWLRISTATLPDQHVGLWPPRCLREDVGLLAAYTLHIHIYITCYNSIGDIATTFTTST